ncbi:MAG: amidohydrolase [Bacteroidetes bacterium]|nr:MAG: amidohydrolase [Bacteroidota bacterium]
MNFGIKALRKELHRYPELSGSETQTARRIKAFIELHHPTKIIDQLGGNGIAAIYEFSDSGPSIAIRCELDALPIEEENEFEYKSTISGVSHKCGHDGHMAIVAGLIFWIKEQSFKSGRIILLFQPAEETGQGAYAVLQDDRFGALDIDYMFALHNIPGEPLHSIITMDQGFSAEVQSFAIEVKGRESHASEPEVGINPAGVISEMIAALDKLNNHDPENEHFAILTPVYMNMGQKSYGISPAKGELHYTIRTWSPEKMIHLKSEIEAFFNAVCIREELTFKVRWFEHFPASRNDAECVQLVNKAASEQGFNIIERPYPFKFGEDFGWFSQKYQSAMFGLGAGLETPALHEPDYDFPEAIIETGINMFSKIISLVFEKHINPGE